jgi:hypothetical protein
MIRPQYLQRDSGGLFPLQLLGPTLRQDQNLCALAHRVVGGQAPQEGAKLRLVEGSLPLARWLRTDRPQRERRSPKAEPALAGKAESVSIKDVGEPYAGKLHARIEAAGGNRRRPATPVQLWRLPPTLPQSASFSETTFGLKRDIPIARQLVLKRRSIHETFAFLPREGIFR